MRVSRHKLHHNSPCVGQGMCVVASRRECDSNSFYYKGLVDLDAEIAKCDKKLTLARLNLEKIMKIVSQPDYAETVPSVVQISNDEKVALLSFDHQN
jgi:hypothetical protein